MQKMLNIVIATKYNKALATNPVNCFCPTPCNWLVQGREAVTVAGFCQTTCDGILGHVTFLHMDGMDGAYFFHIY